MVSIGQEPGFVVGLFDGVREERQFAFADAALDLEPLLLAVFVPGDLEDAATVVLEVEAPVRLAGRDCHSHAAPFRTVLYPLVDRYFSLAQHVVPGSRPSRGVVHAPFVSLP